MSNTLVLLVLMLPLLAAAFPYENGMPMNSIMIHDEDLDPTEDGSGNEEAPQPLTKRMPMNSIMVDDEDLYPTEDVSGNEEAPQMLMKTPELFEPVAFEMVLEKDINGRKDLDQITYDKVLLNTGGGVRADNTTFIAPRSGLYFLYAHVMVHNKDSLTLSIDNNDKSIASGYTPHRIIFGVASITTAALLNKGDVVYTTKEGSRSIRGGQWSRFGGILIQSA